jgi:ankyrin repeat protein
MTAMKKKSTPKKKTISVLKAVAAGDVKAVQAAVAAGVGLLDDMEDTSPLALAVENDDLKMVEALLKLGHKPDLGGIIVPLAEAAYKGNEQIIELLLKHGAKVNEPSEEGETAVMLAAGAGRLAILKRLLKAKADLQQRDSGGQDALTYAVNAGQRETMEFLLPHYPKQRQEKIKRQAHLQENKGTKRESEVVKHLQSAREKSPAAKPKLESLFRAHESGKHDKFLQLLAAGADPNETNAEGTTILASVASFSTVYTLLKPLLEAGADPNRGEVFRPLKFAAGHGLEPVELLLKAKAEVNWANPDGGTALMSAAAAGNDDVVQLLLQAGANPNAEDKDGHTAYWYARECNNPSTAKLLAKVTQDTGDAERPWRKNKEGKSREQCFLDAARGGDGEFVARLLAEGVPVDVAESDGDTALHHAAENDDVPLIEILLQAKAPLEAEGSADWTPLVAAANFGKVQAVRLLLQAGANVHACKDTILCYACESRNSQELVEILLAAGAAVNVVGGFRQATPLHVATEHDQLEVVRLLLGAGAKVNAKDPSGWTPFMNAALRSGVEVVQLLIKAGSDLKVVDKEKRDAYDLASQWGKPEVAKFLKPLLRK